MQRFITYSLKIELVYRHDVDPQPMDLNQDTVSTDVRFAQFCFEVNLSEEMHCSACIIFLIIPK